MKIPFLIFFALFSVVFSYELADPEQPGVTFGEETTGARKILVDENNDGGRVKFVLVTEVTGVLTFNVVSGSQDIIGVALETTDDPSQYYLSANLLDYELLLGQSVLPLFTIDVLLDNDPNNVKTVSLSINNLDDESPTFQVGPCTMMENEHFDVLNSPCVFDISDSDGFLSKMDYTGITGSRGDEGDTFEFRYRDPLPDDNVYEADVYLVLKEGVTLDYELTTLYTFHIEIRDSGNNPTYPLPSIPIIVQVDDAPDQPPRWDSFQSAYTLKENTPLDIKVSAKDGDYGINAPIIYDVVDTSGYVTFDAHTGEIHVAPIDRDIPGNDQIQFTVFAIEEPEPTSNISGLITLIIEDEDDNIPLLSFEGTEEKTFETSVDEGSSEVDVEIFGSDIDLGENAIYDIILDAEDPDFLTAFAVIPVRGYENTTITLAVKDPKALDYENAKWIDIGLTVTTRGTKNDFMTDSVDLIIHLNDVNDEIPIFPSDDYTASIREDAGLGTSIQNIQATDLDAEDANLPHEILGTLGKSILIIEEFGGVITTSKDNAFDYEKMPELIVQVKATDAVGHSATAQLTITILDVNDENPRLFVTGTIEVDENVALGTVLNSTIAASDVDTTADLDFSIDWDQSFGMKTSVQVKTDTIRCIAVKTIPGATRNEVTAELSIVDNSPDFEEFDSLYIYLVIKDKNTEIGSGTDSALIVISIRDLNDNPPVFADDTETAKRSVVENSESGTVITTVVATDRDIGDITTYSIEPADDTTPLWVEIEPDTGIVKVLLTGDDKINCDDGPLFNLFYKVTARDNDTVHEPTAIITIYIVDQNDEVPQMGDKTEEIPEQNQLDPVDPSGTVVVELDPTDADRDDPWNNVTCSFAPSTGLDVTQRFRIENNNIVIRLEGTTLDRESTPEGFDFQVDCMDDFQQKGPVQNHITPYPRISIGLIDVNDNKPTISNPEIREAVNENSKGTVPTALQGDDADIGDNGLIIFNGITKIQRRINIDDEAPQDDPPQDLIAVTAGENKNEGILNIQGDLTNFWGFLVLTISLTDKGDPPLSQNVEVILEVVKYCFEEPKFVYPDESDTSTIYLQPVQDALAGLKLFTGDPLKNLQATDQQNGKFGISFKVAEDSSSGDGNLFTVGNLGNSQGQLQLTTTDFDPIPYSVTVTATIIRDSNVQGVGFERNMTIKVDFFDRDNTDPSFSEHANSTIFLENEAGLTYQVPTAAYTKPDLPPDLKVYYLMREGDRQLFSVDKDSGLVTLLQPLDFEVPDPVYTILIQSSNSENLKLDALDDTHFELTINVGDVNDNPPIFTQKEYVTTLTVSTVTKNTILQVNATDVDTTSQGKLRYIISDTTGSDPSITSIDRPFEMNINTGAITASFTPKDTYKGFFTLKIIVRDEDDGDDHMDTAEVKIYLVTDNNIVRFTFENDVDQVRDSTDAIQEVLDDNFSSSNYKTRVEDPTSAESVDGSPRTTSQVYFVDTNSNVPIEASLIYQRVTDVQFFNQLKQAFQKVNLYLLSFESDSNTTENLEATLKAWLIGVSVVLGALCLILLIAFVLKTRALNQRINKLSNTRFGSQESGLNRTGVAAPTTNKHAIEGSNPVYNNDMDTREIDRRASVTSGDSDLIGVEDDDKFGYNETKEKIIN